jgi:hypothetical protein
MNVGPGIHNTYVDTTIVHNTTIINNNHAAYSGGPGGVNHPPSAQENSYSHEQHVAPTAAQTQHETAARSNTSNYATRNGGHPQNVAMARPAGARPGAGNTNASRAVNYNSSKSNSGDVNAPRGQNGNTPPAKTYNGSHSNTGNAPAERTYNASHSNTNAAPSHPAGGQTHQPAPQQHESHQPPPKQNEHGHR